MGDEPGTFYDMMELLSRSKLPLSIRADLATHPSEDEVQTARLVIGHVMTDADVRGRLPSMKVEPLVRATSILLAASRGQGPAGGGPEVAVGVLEFLDVLVGALGAVPSVLNNRGVARMAVGDTQRARADFDAARRLAPAFIAPRVNELDIYRDAGDFGRLERAGDEILRIDPKNAAALRARLDARISARRPDPEVLEAAAGLHAVGTATAGDLLLLGSLSIKEGDTAAAVKYFKQLVTLDPKSVEGNRHLATAYLTEGDYGAAARVYEQLTELDGPTPEYLLALGLIYDQLDRVGDALQAHELALENSLEKDREVVSEALDEFKERRGIGEVPAEAPPPVQIPAGPLPDEEEMPGGARPDDEGAEPTSIGEGELDLTGEGFEPKVIGEVELNGMVAEEVPVEGFTTVEPPAQDAGEPEPVDPEEAVPAPVPEAPAPEAPAPDAPAPEAPAPDAPAPDAPAPEEPPAPEPPTPEPPTPEPPEPLTPEPSAPEPPEPAGPPDSEELGRALEAAPSGWEDTDAESGDPRAEVAPGEPTDGADERTEPGGRPAPPPVVSAPPRPPTPEPIEAGDVPSDEIERELEALSGALEEGDETTEEGETFRRPSFDVDPFMADLESKTAPTFETLYDGMLEARRKEAADGAGDEVEPTTPYVSAPPIEGLPGMAIGHAPGGGEAPTADDRKLAPAHSFAPYAEGAVPPPIPLLLKEQAEREVTRPRDPVPPPQPGPEPPRPGAPPAAGQVARARQRAEAGDDEEAMRLVNEYLASYRDDAEAWNLKGDLYERTAAEEEALSCYREAVKYNPRLKEAWNNLGVLLHLLGRFEDAASALESGTQVDPDDRHLWHNLGSTYHELGRLEEAIKGFDRAIQADPHDKVSHNNRGTTFFELGDFARARSAFKRAIEIDPEFEQAQNNLGRTLERLGDREEAIASYRRALKLNPQSRTAAANLERLLSAQRDKEPAATGDT